VSPAALPLPLPLPPMPPSSPPPLLPALAALAVLLVMAPVLPGIAVKTKAVLTGRRGAPVMQLYHDLWKLLRKSTVISPTTTWLFRAGPVAVIVSTVAAALLLPLDGHGAILSFAGDLVAFAGLLALARFALVLAGLDTGSSFEGMGASREVTFAAFAEPALLLCFASLALATGDLTLRGMLGAPLQAAWPRAAAPLALAGISLFVLLLAECSRGPVDDPATHLELTMIHEVIVLDHAAPDFALVLLGGALKLALFGALVVGVFAPRAGLGAAAAIAVLAAGLAAVAVAVGVVESTMARLRLSRVPQLLVGASALALFGILLLLR
jgi:formate hydrogenlyase subunit 4